MGKVCSICGKGRQVGYSVSHAHNKTKKVWQPNIQKVRSMSNGTVKRVYACTRCIRSGLITKPIRKPAVPGDSAVA
jgi:large subunit ribosomal protein L28